MQIFKSISVSLIFFLQSDKCLRKEGKTCISNKRVSEQQVYIDIITKHWRASKDVVAKILYDKQRIIEIVY